jgi:hypothetical protein
MVSTDVSAQEKHQLTLRSAPCRSALSSTRAHRRSAASVPIARSEPATAAAPEAAAPTATVDINRLPGDLVPEDEVCLGDGDDLVLAVELDAGMGVGSVLDDAHQGLVAAPPDAHRLAEGAVATESLGRLHGLVLSRVPLQSRVHGAQIGACIWVVGSAAALSCDGVDVARSRDIHAGVFGGVVAVEENEGPVDVDDLALALLSAILADNVVEPDLGTVPISSHRSPPLGQLVGNLRRHHLPGIAILVQDNHRLAVHLDNASDSGGVKLDQVKQRVLAQGPLTANVAGLAQILAEDGDFRVRLVSQERDAVVDDFDDHADFVAETAAANDLDVVTVPEPFAKALVGHLDCLPSEVAFGNPQRDNVALYVDRLANDTPLLALIDLDNIPGYVGNIGIAVLQACGESLKVKIFGSVLGSASKLGHLFEGRVDVLNVQLLDLDVLDLEPVLEILTHVRPGVGLRVALDVAGLALPCLNFAEKALWGSGAGNTKSLALAVGGERQGIVPNAVVQPGNEAHARFQAVLGHVEDLGEVAGVLGRLFQAHPGARLQVGRLGNAQQIRHVLQLDQDHLCPRVNVKDTIQRKHDVVLATSLDVDVALHDRIGPAALKCGRDGNRFLAGSSLLNAAHDGEDDIALLAFLAPDGPDARVVNAREKQALGNDRHLSVAPSRSPFAVPGAQDLGLFLGVHTRLDLAATVELAMSPIIVEVAALGDIVGVGIVDEVFDFFAVLLVVFGFVLVLDLGFDIEESSAVVLAPLATVALQSLSVANWQWQQTCGKFWHVRGRGKKAAGGVLTC